MSCVLSFMLLFLMGPWVGLWYVFVAFPLYSLAFAVAVTFCFLGEFLLEDSFTFSGCSVSISNHGYVRQSTNGAGKLV